MNCTCGSRRRARAAVEGKSESWFSTRRASCSRRGWTCTRTGWACATTPCRCRRPARAGAAAPSSARSA
jgi:hypothetical protein